jgi:Isocitrate/isopropylmalate dehydrogenase
VKIAVIPGDGIGPDVVSAALRVLALLKREHHLDIDWDVVSASSESSMVGRRPIQETGPRTLPHEGIFTAGPLFDVASVVTAADDLPALHRVLAEAVARRPRFVAHVSLTLRAQRSLVSRVPPLALPSPVAGVQDCVDDLLKDHSWVLWSGPARGIRPARCAGWSRPPACRSGPPRAARA